MEKMPKPLLQTRQKNHTDICMVLLENNAKINKKRRNSAKPLFIAMQKGYFDVCTVYICTENNADHKCQPKSGKWCNTIVHFNT